MSSSQQAPPGMGPSVSACGLASLLSRPDTAQGGPGSRSYGGASQPQESPGSSRLLVAHHLQSHLRQQRRQDPRRASNRPPLEQVVEHEGVRRRSEEAKDHLSARPEPLEHLAAQGPDQPVRQVVDIAIDHDQALLGLPGETREELQETVALASELEVLDFGYFVFYPYPGTHLFQVCRTEGYLPEDYLDLEANHRQSILRLPGLSPDDIREAYDQLTTLRERRYRARLDPTASAERVAAATDHIGELARRA